MNASLEEHNSWKLNLYNEYIPENLKYLKCGDIIWLHHTECNSTLAINRKLKAFES
jgi:inositol 1,4,5-triphosphate receptor type 1